MNPLVSILVPAYNSQFTIAETIESALAQTWRHIEIIVVDDGSTDRTLEVARQLDSDRLTVVSQSNQGAAAARNTAFARSKGEYIQWLDADDVIAPDKIELQLAAISRSPGSRVLLSSAWAHFLYRANRANFLPTALWADLSPLEWLLRKMEHGEHMQPATWLVSRELTEAAGPWDTRLTLDDDGEYFCRVILASDCIRFVPAARTYYRISGSNSVSYVGDSDRKLESQLLSCRLHVRYVESLDHCERSRLACLKYLQKYMAMFYERRPDLVEELQAIAAALSGRLQEPRLPWKYEWIRRAFGWRAAVSSARRYNAIKWSLARRLDRVLYEMERGRQVS